MSDDSANNIVDYEEVLRVLSSSFQELWKDNPDVLVYLSELGALGLHQLVQEPDRLAEEKISLLEQTQDLAFHNYKTFIQAAECSQKIFQDFNIIESRLDSLVNRLPEFKKKCSEFGKEAQLISTRWKQASSTLGKHQHLLEFLEMPQLMDNYVKAGYYDEALELASYVKRLERKHVDIPLIKSIINDIQSAANTMLMQLLTKLQTNIQLPECLKIVGYLRRMDVFNETELRIKFLQARDTWFNKVISEIDNSDPYQHVIKVIENSRIHLFDIITQYRAIFSDDDPMLLVHDSSKNNYAIFHSWMTMKVSWFLSMLEKDIHLNLGGRIDSVFAQCMYFGLSFSRVNIDFRPLLIPVFQNAVINKFKKDVELSTQKFEKTIVIYIFSSFTNTAILVPTLAEDSLQPPNCLLDFHPLAQYCNDIINTMNDLKLCCSFSLLTDVIKILTKSVERLVKILVNIYYKKQLSSNEQENKHFIRFCLLLSTELVPHFNKCLSVIFLPEDISQVLGITSMEFKKFEHLYKLNSKILMRPLESILPSTEDDNEETDIGLVINFKNTGSVISSEVQKENNEHLAVTKEENKELAIAKKDNEEFSVVAKEENNELLEIAKEENKEVFAVITEENKELLAITKEENAELLTTTKEENVSNTDSAVLTSDTDMYITGIANSEVNLESDKDSTANTSQDLLNVNNDTHPDPDVHEESSILAKEQNTENVIK